MKRTLILAILAAVLPMMLNSCTTARYVSTEPELNQTWTGHTFADIINTFGAPDRQVDNGNGGVILVYENYSTSSVTTGDNYWYGWHHPYMSPTYRTTTTTDRQYMNFYIGSDYKCYQVKSNYLKQDGRVYSPTKTATACIAGAIVGAAVISAACSDDVYYAPAYGYGYGYDYPYYYY